MFLLFLFDNVMIKVNFKNNHLNWLTFVGLLLLLRVDVNILLDICSILGRLGFPSILISSLILARDSSIGSFLALPILILPIHSESKE